MYEIQWINIASPLCQTYIFMNLYIGFDYFEYSFFDYAESLNDTLKRPKALGVLDITLWRKQEKPIKTKQHSRPLHSRMPIPGTKPYKNYIKQETYACVIEGLTQLIYNYSSLPRIIKYLWGIYGRSSPLL